MYRVVLVVIQHGTINLLVPNCIFLRIRFFVNFGEKLPLTCQSSKFFFDYHWNTLNDVKQTYGNANIVGNDRVVFNIKGNDYRLVTEIDYKYLTVFIIWIGTHKEYDKIDVKTVEYDG